MTITSSTLQQYPNYYKNILDDIADAVDNEILLDELIDYLQPQQVADFINHLRKVADNIEDYIPADFPASEAQVNAYS